MTQEPSEHSESKSHSELTRPLLFPDAVKSAEVAKIIENESRHCKNTEGQLKT